jgi:phage terminase large subunit GpA-like protein
LGIGGENRSEYAFVVARFAQTCTDIVQFQQNLPHGNHRPASLSESLNGEESSEDVLLTSTNTSLVSALAPGTKLRHWYVKCPAASKSQRLFQHNFENKPQK